MAKDRIDTAERNYNYKEICMARTIKSVKLEMDEINNELYTLNLYEAVIVAKRRFLCEKWQRLWDRYFDDGMDY